MERDKSSKLLTGEDLVDLLSGIIQPDEETIRNDLEGKSIVELSELENTEYSNSCSYNDSKDFIASELITSLAIYLNEALKADEIRDNKTAKELAVKACQGDVKARNELVQGHLRLAIRIAKNMWGKSNSLIEDLIQEGNLGLIEASTKYGEKETQDKFISYASMWILRRIQRFTYVDTVIPFPVYLAEEISKISTNMDGAWSLDEYEWRKSNYLNYKFYSLDSILRSNFFVNYEGTDMFWYLDDYLEELEKDEYRQIIRDALEKLDSRQKYVIEGRFGFEGYREKTLEELGQQLGLTRERIRQIEDKALKKLGEIITEGIDKKYMDKQTIFGHNLPAFSDPFMNLYKLDMNKYEFRIRSPEINSKFIQQWERIDTSRSLTGIHEKRTGQWGRDKQLKEYIVDIMKEHGDKMSQKQISKALINKDLNFADTSIYQVLRTNPDLFVKIDNKWDLKERISLSFEARNKEYEKVDYDSVIENILKTLE